MARTRTISDEQILEAAREVFFEEGIQGTTAEIARRAGISEGTIFRRFPTKQDLFLAAMGLSQGPVWIETLQELQGQGDLEANLIRIADEILDFFLILIPKMHLVLTCGANVSLPDVFEGPGEAPPLRALKAVMGFFLAEQKAGRMRATDPEILARMFLGSLHHWAFAEICGINDYMAMPRQTCVRGIVDNLIRATRPDPS